MGSMNLTCPMCCGETFNNSQSLKYHLLSMTDNLYCPGCSQRSDSVTALIQHLDRCGKDSDLKLAENLEREGKKHKLDPEEGQERETKSEVLMETNVEQLDQSFLATVNHSEIMIVGGPRTIEVDENGEIKVIEKVDAGEDQMESSDMTELREIETLPIGDMDAMDEKEDDFTNSESLIKLGAAEIDSKEKANEVLRIIPNDAELLEDEGGTLIRMDNVNEMQEELNNDELLHVKQEFCEVKEEEVEAEAEALYSCSSCGMSFNSVLEHIKQFHDGQEVVLEMAEQQLEDLPTTSTSTTTATTLSQDSASVVTTRQRQTMNTLRTEECVDSEGRLYTRKVVQIERFWDRPQATLPSTKSPMIEKFFSNVEGVKVRDKNVSSTPARVYRCNQCLENFSKLSDFRVHVCLHGNNQCEHCVQAFATAKALQLHMRIHEGESYGVQRVFVCTACGTEFSSHKSLRLHSRMHAPVRARHVDAPEGTHSATFTCLECGKTLSESYRGAHMALHTTDSVTCAVCNRKFDSADSLAMHAAVHTELSQSHSTTPSTGEAAEPVDVQKPYQCQHCGRRFTRPHEKVKHERIHTGEKPHACEVCGKTFRVSYCLTLHMRTHTGVRPYACQHCGKRFKASSVYNHHLLTHGEERAYTCPHCPKTFKTRVQLAGHKNSHTKPFRCTECSRPFASLYAARAHIQTHKKDNNLKFSCYICGASYGRAFALKDHLKQHGQDVLPPPEPAREEEVHEGDDFLLAEEEVEEDELVIPSPLPVAQSSEPEESD